MLYNAQAPATLHLKTIKAIIFYSFLSLIAILIFDSSRLFAFLVSPQIDQEGEKLLIGKVCNCNVHLIDKFAKKNIIARTYAGGVALINRQEITFAIPNTRC